MKKAKNHIEETDQNKPPISWLAEFVTPGGELPFIFAQIVRERIANMSDESFKETHGGATKESVRRFLRQWELCDMKRWGADELEEIITSSNPDRTTATIRRAISIAQSTKDLPEFFSPERGVQWALSSRYAIHSVISLLLAGMKSATTATQTTRGLWTLERLKEFRKESKKPGSSVTKASKIYGISRQAGDKHLKKLKAIEATDPINKKQSTKEILSTYGTKK